MEERAVFRECHLTAMLTELYNNLKSIMRSVTAGKPDLPGVSQGVYASSSFVLLKQKLAPRPIKLKGAFFIRPVLAPRFWWGVH